MPRHSIKSVLPTSVNDGDSFNSMVSLPVQWRRRCKSSCGCVCHSRYQCKTSPVVRRFFGALFLGYVGPPLLTLSCNDEMCQSRLTRSFSLVYCFPQWFILRAIYVVAAMTYTGCPVFGLEVRRRIEWGGKDGILRFVLNGNTKGVQHLLVNKTASLTDVDPNYGRSALHVSMKKLRPLSLRRLTRSTDNTSMPSNIIALKPANISSKLEQILTWRMIVACEYSRGLSHFRALSASWN